MADVPDDLKTLSDSVFESANEAAFALMQANYTERKAPELGPEEMVRGLEPHARDLAIRFRESIWYRYDALRFHHELLVKVHDGYHQALVKAGPLAGRDGQSFNIAYNAVLREQALFDDVVFQSISLFDYLGNAAWFGFHGQNFVKKKWKNLRKAACDEDFERRTTRGSVKIAGSATGALVASLDDEFVSQLSEYRATLFHYHIDAAPGGVTHRFTSDPGDGSGSAWSPELNVGLPNDYASTVKALVDQDSSNDNAEVLTSGAERLIRKVGESTVRLLNTLSSDLGWDKSAGLAILS